MGKKKIGKMTWPAGTQSEQITEAFKQLGMDSAASSFDVIVRKVYEDQGTAYDLLQAVLEMEFNQKEDSRKSRWIQQAKLLSLKSIKDYEFSEQPSIDPVLLNELASCRFIEQGGNVIFLGPPGVGKTHLSCAIALEAIEHGHDVRCMRLNEFLSEVRKSSDEAITRLFNSLIKPDLLILDDIDYYKTNEDAAEFLFDVVKRRYENRSSLIITSNKSPDEWGDLFGTKRAGAAMDRIFDRERATVINITGGSSHRVPRLNTPSTEVATDSFMVASIG